jgi:hypothetical protein
MQMESMAEEVDALKSALGQDAVEAIKFYKEREKDMKGKEIELERLKLKEQEEEVKRIEKES